MNKLSKQDMLVKIEEEHQLLLNTFQTLTPSQMVEPGALPLPEPGQSTKDILAHLVAWEQRMLVLSRAIIAGNPPSAYPTAPKFNMQVFYSNKDRQLEDILRDFEQSYSESLTFVQQLPDEEIDKDGVWQLIAYNTYNHYKWARTMIRRWYRTQNRIAQQSMRSG